jgi:hypothetical protein
MPLCIRPASMYGRRVEILSRLVHHSSGNLVGRIGVACHTALKTRRLPYAFVAVAFFLNLQISIPRQMLQIAVEGSIIGIWSCDFWLDDTFLGSKQRDIFGHLTHDKTRFRDLSSL